MKKDSHFWNVTEYFGDTIIPDKYRQGITKYFNRAGKEYVPYRGFGLTLYFVTLFSILLNLYIVTTPLFFYASILVKILVSIIILPLIFTMSVVIVTFIYRVYLDTIIAIRVSKMEDVFPEFLSVLSLNLRSGQSLEVALSNSTDKEFHPLSHEIRGVISKVRLGKKLNETLKEFISSYNSPVIRDSFELIILSNNKGGNTADLVDRIQDNLKTSRFLKEKIIASVSNYKIFLTLLAFFIAPAMFALTYHLISLIRNIADQLTIVSDSAVVPFVVTAVRLSDNEFILFSNLAAILIASCIAIIISVVKNGHGKYAFKQIIMYILISHIAYRVMLFVFGLFFNFFSGGI